MVYRSMINDCGDAHELYIKRGCPVLEDFIFFDRYYWLSCIAKQVTSLKQFALMSSSDSLDMNFEYHVPIMISHHCYQYHVHLNPPVTLTASPSSSSHLSYQFIPLPIRFLAVFHCLHLLIDHFLSSLTYSLCFPQLMPSNFPTNTLSLSIDIYSLPSLLLDFFPFYSFLAEHSNMFLWSW